MASSAWVRRMRVSSAWRLLGPAVERRPLERAAGCVGLLGPQRPTTRHQHDDGDEQRADEHERQDDDARCRPPSASTPPSGGARPCRRSARRPSRRRAGAVGASVSSSSSAARSASTRSWRACRRAAPVCSGSQPGDHVLDPHADVDGVVADALVVAADEGELHRGLQVDEPGVVRLEDGLDVVLVQQVEAVVHVVERGGQAGVALDVGVDGQAEQAGRLLAHALDQPAQPRVELHAVDAPRRPWPR